MLMCIDVGNTDIAIAVYKQNDFITSFRIHTSRIKTSDEYDNTLQSILKDKHLSFEDMNGICISSVVPKVTASLVELFERYPAIKVVNLGLGIKTGLKIKADNPKEVGADIIASVVAAKEKYGNNVFIIDLGTATTITYLSQDEVMEGVVIIPGVMSMLKSLTENTSLLPSVNIQVPDTVLGNNTIHCMQSGITYGQASMIEGILERIENQRQLSNVKVVMTGGFSTMISKVMKRNTIIDKDLLLDGLKMIYKKNVEQCQDPRKVDSK